MMAFFIRLARHRSGATAIEYGLIAGLVAVVIMASVVGMASEVGSTYSKAGVAMNTANA
jgi:pilus assembly protein Flp/PilA